RTAPGTADHPDRRDSQCRPGRPVPTPARSARRRPAPGGRDGMTFTRLLWRNLLYHRRGNLAVLLGVAVGTAVLVGALLVGDSLRGSLRGLALRRLGWVDEALVVPRFFREDLAKELQDAGAADYVCPALLLQGSVSKSAPGRPPRSASKVTICGVDNRFLIAGGDWLGKPGSEEEIVYLNA